MHPRVKAFLLFLLFAVLSNVVAEGLGWLILFKLHAIDTNDRSWRPGAFVWFESISTIGALIATWIVARIARRPVATLGYSRAHALRQFAAGSLFGLTAVVVLVAAITVLGGFRFGAISGAQFAFPWLAAFLLVGLAEETEYRAAGLLTLADAIGFWPAAIGMSLLFGALHYFLKPMENIADALSVGLLGLFMCFTVLRTGAIWFAAGFHALFDYAAIFLFGAPNSGNDGHAVPTKLLSGGFHGPARLTGGPLGVEASWLVFPLIALLFVAFSIVRYNPPHSAPNKSGGTT